MDLYDRHKDKGTQPSCDEISRAFQSVTAIYSRVFVIVGALDEWQNSDGCCTRFLVEMFKLQTEYRVNIFATSRSIPEITENFTGRILLQVLASNEDVRKCLDGQMYRLP
jgi:hypothetical protein